MAVSCQADLDNSVPGQPKQGLATKERKVRNIRCRTILLTMIALGFGITSHFAWAAGDAVKHKLLLQWAKPEGRSIKEPVTQIPNVEYKNLVGSSVKNGYSILRLVAAGPDGKPVEHWIEGKKLEFSEKAGTMDMFMNNFAIAGVPGQSGHKLYGTGTVSYTVYETNNPEAPTLDNSQQISNTLTIKYTLDQR
jgi:hypothetical protein